MLREIGDFLERPAGHMLVLVSLLGLGVGMHRAGLIEHANEVISAAIGALLYSMRLVAKP